MTPTSAPVINGAGSSLTAESCSPGNGAIDPGETVSLAFALQNVGIADTTHLVATLLPAGGVLAPSSPQNYGILVAGGPPATHVFSFTSQGACGGIITPTFQLQDGPANLGVVTFNLALGVASALTPLNQNFDSVAAPALPAGWTTTSVDGGSTWSGAGWTSASPPNSAYCPDSANPGLGELLSPVFAISSASAMLTFDNNYDLEADP